MIARRVAEKKVTRSRLEADVRRRRRATAGGGRRRQGARRCPKERVAALDDAFAEAAGVPTVVKAVADSTRLRANRATGWPVTAWFSRLKPDPLKRLHLDLGAAGKAAHRRAPAPRCPQATRIQRARVDTEVRALADQVGEGMAPLVGRRRCGGPRSRACPTSATGSTVPSPPPTSAPTRSPSGPALVRVLQCVLIVSALRRCGLARRCWPSAPTPACPMPPTPEVGRLRPARPAAARRRRARPAAGPGVPLAGLAHRAGSRAASADKRLRDAISEVSAGGGRGSRSEAELAPTPRSATGSRPRCAEAAPAARAASVHRTARRRSVHRRAAARPPVVGPASSLESIAAEPPPPSTEGGPACTTPRSP